MSADAKLGQVCCCHAKTSTPDELVEMVQKYHIGSLFFAYRTATDCKAIMDAVNAAAEIPVIANADLVNGAGSRIENCTLFPWQMAVGAADSEDLAEKMGIATAHEGRACGLHWTFGPIVDISVNIHNSMMHTRTFGEAPGHVTRMSKAFIRGVQKDGLMAASAKHFPGDGIDDRDSHICTSINPLGEDEWMATFGRIWQDVINDGTMTIMSGHIALPWIDPGSNYLGPLPATLSRKIQIDLLREHLGFQGVIISDAIPMIGFSCQAAVEERIPLNIETGSDMILWPIPERDFVNMQRALDNGLLSEERLDTAVRNVLGLKHALGLLGGDQGCPLTEEDRTTYQRWADEIGEGSITIIRNEGDLLPASLKPGARVLTVSCSFEGDTRGFVQDLDVVDEELRCRGFEVDHRINPSNAELNRIGRDYDAVFMNVHVMPRYGTTRFFGQTAQVFWDSFWHNHPCVVFTSFGCFIDPYKLYEMPYVPNYVNTFSNTPSSQKAVVKVWLGEMPAKGKSPVRLEGYYEMGVE